MILYLLSLSESIPVLVKCGVELVACMASSLKV